MHLEPQLFDNEEAKKADVDTQVFWLCRMLKCLRTSQLPTVTHEIPRTVEGLGAALSQHYVATGGLVGQKTLANLKAGYYVKDETNLNIVCTEDTKENKTKITLEHCSEVGILNPLDVETELRVVTGGHQMKIDTMAAEFRTAGVALPELEVDWQGALFGTKKAPVNSTPQKRKASTADSPSSGGQNADPSAFASKSGVMLGEALRRKMTKTTSTQSASSAAKSPDGKI